MAATLIVEDGSGKTDANTYISLAEYDEYISCRGFVDTGTDAEKTARIIQSKDWIEEQDPLFQGWKHSENQALIWPRSWVVIYGFGLDSDEIPQQLKDAQAQLTFDSATTDIYNVNDGLAVTKEKIDVIETEYSDNGVVTVQPIFAKVQAILEPLYSNLKGAGSVMRI